MGFRGPLIKSGALFCSRGYVYGPHISLPACSNCPPQIATPDLDLGVGTFAGSESAHTFPLNGFAMSIQALSCRLTGYIALAGLICMPRRNYEN